MSAAAVATILVAWISLSVVFHWTRRQLREARRR